MHRDLVASEESLSFQCFVWDVEKPEVIAATLQDHTHVVCRETSGLERETHASHQQVGSDSQIKMLWGPFNDWR